MSRQSLVHRIISAENITSIGTSVQSGAAPFGANVARVVSTAAVNIVINNNPTATTATGAAIRVTDEAWFVVSPSTTVGGTDGDKIASIGTATVNVTWLAG